MISEIIFNRQNGPDKIRVRESHNDGINLPHIRSYDYDLDADVDVLLAQHATQITEPFTSNATTLELDYVYSDKRYIAVDTVAVSGMTNGQVTAYLYIAKHVSTLEIFGCPSPVIT